jgi:hypothetical protein
MGWWRLLSQVWAKVFSAGQGAAAAQAASRDPHEQKMYARPHLALAGETCVLI